MAKFGIIHYNTPGSSLDDFLKYAADTGFGYVELNISDIWDESSDAAAEANVEAVRAKLKSYGIKASAVSARNDFIQLESEAIDKQVRRMRRVAELTRLLEPTAVLRTESGAPKASVPRDQWLDSLYNCFSRCDFLDELDARLAIDNHGPVSNDADLLHALLTRLNNKRIGTNLDTMNYRHYGHDIATCNRIYDMMAPHVLHTHMKDGFGSQAEYRGQALGEGEIDLQHALKALRSVGYDGVYCAEYEGKEIADGAGYARCLAWLKANVG